MATRREVPAMEPEVSGGVVYALWAGRFSPSFPAHCLVAVLAHYEQRLSGDMFSLQSIHHCIERRRRDKLTVIRLAKICFVPPSPDARLQSGTTCDISA